VPRRRSRASDARLAAGATSPSSPITRLTTAGHSLGRRPLPRGVRSPRGHDEASQALGLDRAPATRPTAGAWSTCASRCTTGGCRGSRWSIAIYIRPAARSGSSMSPHRHARCRRPRRRRVRVLRDITESKRVEEELHDLSRRLIRAHEEERALLARELHDDVTQRLAVLAIDAGRAEIAAEIKCRRRHCARSARARAPERGHPLPGVPVAPLGPRGARPRRGAAAECERRSRQGRSTSGGARPAAAPSRRTRRSACSGGAGGAQQRGRHAGARAASVTLKRMDGGCCSPSATTAPASTRRARESGGASAGQHARARAAGERHARHRERAGRGRR